MIAHQYLPVLVFFVIAMCVSLAMVFIAFVRGKRLPSKQKLDSYECGFEAFNNSRMKFDVRFYLVAILFIIFDLEVAFLFPWAVSLLKIGWYGFWSMMLFLLTLTVGFVYEWRKGALDWH